MPTLEQLSSLTTATTCHPSSPLLSCQVLGAGPCYVAGSSCALCFLGLREVDPLPLPNHETHHHHSFAHSRHPYHQLHPSAFLAHRLNRSLVCPLTRHCSICMMTTAPLNALNTLHGAAPHPTLHPCAWPYFAPLQLNATCERTMWGKPGRQLNAFNATYT
jgi:hypothetical protein